MVGPTGPLENGVFKQYKWTPETEMGPVPWGQSPRQHPGQWRPSSSDTSWQYGERSPHIPVQGGPSLQRWGIECRNPFRVELDQRVDSGLPP